MVVIEGRFHALLFVLLEFLFDGSRLRSRGFDFLLLYHSRVVVDRRSRKSTKKLRLARCSRRLRRQLRLHSKQPADHIRVVPPKLLEFWGLSGLLFGLGFALF